VYRVVVLFWALLLSGLHAYADNPVIPSGDNPLGGFESDFDESAKSWHEVAAQIPPYPKEGDLIPFTVSAASANRFYVDYPSVTVGSDAAVRYTVLIRSPSGAETVSYEGMRCDEGERKLYAFGHAGGEWSRNRYARWEPIQVRNQNNYQRALFYHYFCTVDGGANLTKIRYFLKSGGYYDQN
jgi:hypothetical protein